MTSKLKALGGLQGPGHIMLASQQAVQLVTKRYEFLEETLVLDLICRNFWSDDDKRL